MSSRRLEELESEKWLTDEIMYLIIGKLMLFPMFLARFSAVCKRWHRLICDSWPKLVQEHQITPLILLPTVDRMEEGVVKQVSCQIYNLIGKRAPALVNSLPCGFNRIIGSSLGWLIIVCEDTNCASMSLFNPLSKFLIPIRPPHSMYCLHDWTLMKGILSQFVDEEEDDQYFDIAITMKPPAFSEICKTATVIALCRVKKIESVQSVRWVYHHCAGKEILDLNFIRGRICILYSGGIVKFYKWNSKHKMFFLCCNGVINKWFSRVNVDHLKSLYLLESSSSEPLVVFNYKSSFKISTLDLTEENVNSINIVLNLTEIKTLGNDVIFLSEIGNSVCIQAGYKMQFAAGSIYLAESDDRSRIINIGVFNVHRNCFTHFTHQFDGTNFLQVPHIWLMPSYDEILKFSSIID